ncbi:hypothetical protein [Agromyces sp. NPDC058064]|uniref:hypothetical protein n=1 Tax=Agromyces sp. NPDC058064 TaxID=3346322 RepID=UPI0036DA6EB3
MPARARAVGATTVDLPAPIPEDAPRYFGTVTRVLGSCHLLTSWVEGRATSKLGVLDLDDGTWRVGGGLRSPIRAALALPGDRALLLGDYGLVEFDLGALEVVRSLTAKIGKHNSLLRFDEDDPGRVVVGNRVGSTEVLVSLESLSFAGRRRRRVAAVEPIGTEAAAAGIQRVLLREAGLLVGATNAERGAPQQLVVVSGDGETLARADLPDGVESAHLVRDGVIAAAPDLGPARGLTAVTGLFEMQGGAAAAGGARDRDSTLEALVTAATRSAEAILRQRARRTPPRTVVRGIRLEAGDELTDVSAARITLDGCDVARAGTGGERARLARVQVTDLEIRSASVSGAVLEDVVVDGLRNTTDFGFVFGCELRRVTLRGRIRHLVLNPELHDPDPAVGHRYAEWHRARLEDPEWMLDLRDATGDIEIRGYPSRFIRRNPELHAVVTAESLATSDWRSIDGGRSVLHITLEFAERHGWEDAVLVVDPHGRAADDDFRFIRELRARGIAEPD